MTRFFLFLSFSFLFLGNNSNGTIITSAQTGDWDVGATWVGGVAPVAEDDAIIANTHTVTLVEASVMSCII